MGAFYEGYEDRVLKLLRNIEFERFGKPCDKLVTPRANNVSRGYRELKNLISTTNYEAGSSRRRAANSGGHSMLQ